MKVKRILSLALVTSMLSCMPVMAKEDISIISGDEGAALEYLQSIELEKQAPKPIDSKQAEVIFNKEPEIQTFSVNAADAYEPNDTYTTAFPYEKVNELQPQLTSRFELFSLGMRNAGLHSATDEDWFSVELTAGEQYFVDLRNIGKTNWFIELYYLSSDQGGYYYTTDPTIYPIYEKWQEKYFYFEAQDTGTYYIRITNGGDWTSDQYYFFYVGPAVKFFDIVDLPTYGSVQIYGSSYKTYTCDLRDAVPSVTAIANLSMSDKFPQGTICSEVEKYMSTGGKTYYNRTGGGSDTLSGISNASLGELWTIGARCAKGTHYTNWAGVLNGRFGCVMAPYPGNELQ